MLLPFSTPVIGLCLIAFLYAVTFYLDFDEIGGLVIFGVLALLAVVLFMDDYLEDEA